MHLFKLTETFDSKKKGGRIENGPSARNQEFNLESINEINVSETSFGSEGGSQRKEERSGLCPANGVNARV